MQPVIIRTFDNYFSASIMLSRLHADGIECYLKDEYTVTIDPILTNAVGGIKLVVKDQDEEAVKKLLAAYEAEYMKSACCPKCGSNSFTFIAKPGLTNFVTAILTWLLSNYAVAQDYVYHCEECGYENEHLPETFNDPLYNPN